MRGSDERSGSLFSYVDLEARVRADHPLRVIRDLANAALGDLSEEFGKLYTDFGRPSIAPEKLLRAMQEISPYFSGPGGVFLFSTRGRVRRAFPFGRHSAAMAPVELLSARTPLRFGLQRRRDLGLGTLYRLLRQLSRTTCRRFLAMDNGPSLVLLYERRRLTDTSGNSLGGILFRRHVLNRLCGLYTVFVLLRDGPSLKLAK